MFDQERLQDTNDWAEQLQGQFQTMNVKLCRSRRRLDERPGTASMLAGEVLLRLDSLDAARQDTHRMRRP